MTELEASHNAIEDEGAVAMAKMVESRQDFQRLVLSKNSIGEAGASAFAVALNAHQGLEELELHRIA